MGPIAIVGQLKPGWEETGMIADRLGVFFDGLAKIDPLFGCWLRGGDRRHHPVVPAQVTIPAEQMELRSWIDEGRNFGSREGRKKTIGYLLQARTPKEKPIRADFWLDYQPGEWWFGRRMGGTIFSGTSSLLDGAGGPQALIALLRRVLVVTGSAWDCDWAGVLPGRYPLENDPIRKPGPIKYQSGWMVYLDPSTATSLGRPQDIAIESLPNGGMLLSAAPNSMFNAHNGDHWAAALRIQAALAPLNAAHNE
jgi:hypothetical protein